MVDAGTGTAWMIVKQAFGVMNEGVVERRITRKFAASVAS